MAPLPSTHILAEDLLTLPQAAKEVPRPEGKKPLHHSTIWRWSQKGIRGHKLQTVQVGQQRVTSKQRLNAFLEATEGSN